MTNRIAAILVLLAAAAVWYDQTTQGGVWTYMIGRKLVDLIDWVAFWR